MNSILIIFMFMVGCEVPAGILSYQFINFSSQEEVFLPDCRNLTKEDAILKLNSINLEVKIIELPYNPNKDSGTITHMVPSPFTKIKTGRVVSISVAGYKKDIIVPDFKNMTLRNAKIHIANSGFTLDSVVYDYNPIVDKGLVIAQTPNFGTVLLSGDPISINVSKGNPSYYYTMPNLINMSFDQAKKKIINEGLKLGKINYIYNRDLLPNTIIAQGVTPALKLVFPVEVNLDVSKNEK